MKNSSFKKIVCLCLTIVSITTLFQTLASAKTRRDVERIESAAESLGNLMNKEGFDSECFYSEKTDTFYCGYKLGEIESAANYRKYSSVGSKETETVMMKALYNLSKSALQKAGFDDYVAIMCFVRAKNDDVLFAELDRVDVTDLLSN